MWVLLYVKPMNEREQELSTQILFSRQLHQKTHVCLPNQMRSQGAVSTAFPGHTCIHTPAVHKAGSAGAWMRDFLCTVWSYCYGVSRDNRAGLVNVKTVSYAESCL